MKKKELLSALLTGLASLLLFTSLTVVNLQHTFAFLMPVLLAVHIMRFNIKSAIIPAILMLVAAPFISHFLPLETGDYVRGLVFMPAAVVVGFLHGGLSKTNILHSQELLMVILSDLLFGFLGVIVFSLTHDPHFEITTEFNNYYASFATIFNIPPATLFGENIKYLFTNSWIAYTVCFSIIEAIITHMLIHVIMKFVVKEKAAHSFTGLDFNLSKLGNIFFLVGFILTLSVFGFAHLELNNAVLVLFVMLINVTLSAQLFFSFQGIIVLITWWGIKKRPNLTHLIFVFGLIFFPLTALLGAFSGLFKIKDKLLAKYSEQSIDYLTSNHS